MDAVAGLELAGSRVERIELTRRLPREYQVPGGSQQRAQHGIAALPGPDLRPMITQRFPLDPDREAYDLFAHQRDGVLKVAIAP